MSNSVIKKAVERGWKASEDAGKNLTTPMLTRTTRSGLEQTIVFRYGRWYYDLATRAGSTLQLSEHNTLASALDEAEKGT